MGSISGRPPYTSGGLPRGLSPAASQSQQQSQTERHAPLTRSVISNSLKSQAQWGVSLLSPCVHSSVLPCLRQLPQRIQWAKPADGLQDPTSRSSKAPQLPAIAEDPGAGAAQREPDRQVAGAATKVTAQALESSLRAAIEAQRRLRARRKHRDKLLHALNKVTCPCPKLVTLQMQLICLSGRITLMDGPSITESCPEACLCVREVKCEQLLAGRQALAGVWRGTRPTDVAAGWVQAIQSWLRTLLRYSRLCSHTSAIPGLQCLHQKHRRPSELPFPLSPPGAVHLSGF